MAERKKVQKINPKAPPKRTATKKETTTKKVTTNKKATPPKNPSKTVAKNKQVTRVEKPKTQNIPMTSKPKTAKKPHKENRPINRQVKPPVSKRPQHQKTTKPPKKHRDYNIIQMVSGSIESGLSVIKGKKAENERKRLITFFVSVILVICVIVFCATAPTGPIEKIANAFTLLGSGDFPASISGGTTVTFKMVDDKSFILTDSHISGFNSSGYKFFDYQHNFSSPVLNTSKERILVYNRESSGFIIANNTDVVFDKNLETPIYCGDIGYNGSVAFATKSDSYAAQILVFDKGMSQYFSWYLADGLVTDIALSNNGENLAVSVLKVENGSFNSEIYCLDVDEKDPVYIKEIKGESVVELETVSSGNFVYVSDESTGFIGFDSSETVKVGIENISPYFFKTTKYGTLAVYSETANSKIFLFDSDGETKESLEFNGLIDNIAVFDDGVFILNSNQIYVLDFTGKQTNVINLQRKPTFILGLDDGVLTTDNLHINYYSAKP